MSECWPEEDVWWGVRTPAKPPWSEVMIFLDVFLRREGVCPELVSAPEMSSYRQLILARTLYTSIVISIHHFQILYIIQARGIPKGGNAKKTMIVRIAFNMQTALSINMIIKTSIVLL